MIEEPEFPSLPTEEDFYYDGDCDERYAIKEYLSRSISPDME